MLTCPWLKQVNLLFGSFVELFFDAVTFLIKETPQQIVWSQDWLVKTFLLLFTHHVSVCFLEHWSRLQPIFLSSAAWNSGCNQIPGSQSITMRPNSDMIQSFMMLTTHKKQVIYTVHLWTFLDKYVQQIVCGSSEMCTFDQLHPPPPKTHTWVFPLGS